MKNDCDGNSRFLSAKDPWECTGEPIPEVFPTRLAFLKTVALGIGITLGIYGALSLIIIKPWQ